MKRPGQSEHSSATDPIALTLAVWLGLVTCGVGVSRLAEDASAQAALAEVRAEALIAIDGLGKAPAQPASSAEAKI